MVRLLDDPDYRYRIADRAASDMASRYNDEAAAAAITQRLAVLALAREPDTLDDIECAGRMSIDHGGRVHEPHVA